MKAILLLLALSATLVAEPVTFRIDPKESYEISPYIYGANQADWKWMAGTRLGSSAWGSLAAGWYENANSTEVWLLQVIVPASCPKSPCCRRICRWRNISSRKAASTSTCSRWIYAAETPGGC